jgi:hypothetical protein
LFVFFVFTCPAIREDYGQRWRSGGGVICITWNSLEGCYFLSSDLMLYEWKMIYAGDRQITSNIIKQAVKQSWTLLFNYLSPGRTNLWIFL